MKLNWTDTSLMKSLILMAFPLKDVTEIVMEVVWHSTLKITCSTSAVFGTMSPFLPLKLCATNANRSAPLHLWYLPGIDPRDESVDIFRQLEESLQFLDNENKGVILLGDTNCDLLVKHSSTEPTSAHSLPAHSKRLMEIYDLFGFQQLIDKATRVTLTSKTLIDHIATTNKV